jgi:hypothetical protein
VFQIFAGSMMVRRASTAQAARDAADLVRRVGIVPDIRYGSRLLDHRQLALMIRGEDRFGAPDDAGAHAPVAAVEPVP